MARIKVNYSLNQTFFVSEEAIQDIISKASSNVKLSSVKNKEIKIDDKGQDFSVVLDVDVKGSFKESLTELTKEIEQLSMNIIDTKPTNISINVL